MSEGGSSPTNSADASSSSATINITDGDSTISQDSQFDRWNKKLRLVTGLGLRSEEERQEWLQRRCLGWKDEIMETSPMIRYLLQHLSVLPVPDQDSSGSQQIPIPIDCDICIPLLSAGLFSPTDPDPSRPSGGQIKLCANSLPSKSRMEDVLSHELIHAYDHRRFKMDWKNLFHVACTEVRANALSGDCNWTREVDRHVFTFAKQRQACARRRAILSVAQHISEPLEPDNPLRTKATDTAEKIVDQVWSSCWNDTRPFDEIY
ncbi:hypothetical protein O181_001978 [Austropuccinia psidii MF-1]|uniref:Mitochondrial inner membrane protease ATP23 n=1 Tax=Austropuccinia psidii MF-1 TaxID=1389203 RepID=A0A9Q3GC74_9BASI|nr:hypothetical protein [Austropuccinia psidii MF-1]